MSFSFKSFALAASLALASNACIVQWGEGDFDDDGFTGLDDDGFIDDDGTGGADPGTGGTDPGTGGTDPGTGGTDPGTGGGGGDTCSIQDEDPYAWELCDAMPSSPSNMGLCDDGLASITYDACLKGYEILNPRDGDYLQTCLSEIAPADACVADLAAECIDDTYATACLSDDIPAMCQMWGDACAGGGESFDVPRCTDDLNSMNQQAIDTLAACIADSPENTCQDRYEVCFDQLVAMDSED